MASDVDYTHVDETWNASAGTDTRPLLEGMHLGLTHGNRTNIM